MTGIYNGSSVVQEGIPAKVHGLFDWHKEVWRHSCKRMPTLYTDIQKMYA